MKYSQAKKYLLARPEALEEYPFGPEVAVFKINQKMFATLARNHNSDDNPAYRDCARINLKCDPDEALMLRDVFSAVLPGYHMNKKHWNTVVLDASIPSAEIKRMIDRSYGLVVKGLSKAERLALELRHSEAKLYR